MVALLGAMATFGVGYLARPLGGVIMSHFGDKLDRKQAADTLIHVHGGVGFTWDVDCHLLFRRVKANDVLFGRQAWQRQRLADLVLSGIPPQ